jgi:hypothetical protein
MSSSDLTEIRRCRALLGGVLVLHIPQLLLFVEHPKAVQLQIFHYLLFSLQVLIQKNHIIMHLRHFHLEI